MHIQLYYSIKNSSSKPSRSVIIISFKLKSINPKSFIFINSLDSEGLGIPNSSANSYLEDILYEYVLFFL